MPVPENFIFIEREWNKNSKVRIAKTLAATIAVIIVLGILGLVLQREGQSEIAILVLIAVPVSALAVPWIVLTKMPVEEDILQIQISSDSDTIVASKNRINQQFRNQNWVKLSESPVSTLYGNVDNQELELPRDLYPGNLTTHKAYVGIGGNSPSRIVIRNEIVDGKLVFYAFNPRTDRKHVGGAGC